MVEGGFRGNREVGSRAWPWPSVPRHQLLGTAGGVLPEGSKQTLSSHPKTVQAVGQSCSGSVSATVQPCPAPACPHLKPEMTTSCPPRLLEAAFAKVMFANSRAHMRVCREK